MEEEFKDRVVSGAELLGNDFSPRGLYMFKRVDDIEYSFESVALGWYSYVGQRDVKGEVRLDELL